MTQMRQTFAWAPKAQDSEGSGALRYIWGALRIVMGAIFLWAFLDKTFGLGFATKAKDAWLAGGHPTAGFLKFATAGPFAGFYQTLAGNVFVDWLFMMGLLGIGLALVLGIGVKVAGWSGALLMILMWSARLPPANHPLLDDHVVYALVLVAFAMSGAGRVLGFGDAWRRTKLVRDHPALE